MVTVISMFVGGLMLAAMGVLATIKVISKKWNRSKGYLVVSIMTFVIGIGLMQLCFYESPDWALWWLATF
jgi:hypothetical protein